ncbi:TfoX/Sxy family protein [Allobranchiibius sp. GilTou73]|uniref:TfoX/Sxy family protein n=1 Tax=Allobranchiibius sp. GilTou73 TaxID=2904523 RepID=UPI001F2DBE0A|nr:TfoX/Sxy family protein [Allobranchiibius sp. GilTou73]UIJ34200.1 TfoX/Sxy family protein [Allobranchiibius sp. GilTou73]
MPYDRELAQRIRVLVEGSYGLSEKAMFGGLAFLINGHLAVAAGSRGALMVRVAPEQTAQLLDPPRVERFVMRGRALDGWLDVSPEAVADDEALHRWVDEGMTYAASLPPREGTEPGG